MYPDLMYLSFSPSVLKPVKLTYLKGIILIFYKHFLKIRSSEGKYKALQVGLPEGFSERIALY